MLSTLFDTYVDQNPHRHSLKLSHLLLAVIMASFVFAAVSIAYTAGRQSGPAAPTTVEVRPAR